MRRTRTTFESASSHACVTKGRALPIIVEIEGDTLTFREKGRRQRYAVPIADAMKLAILHTRA